MASTRWILSVAIALLVTTGSHVEAAVISLFGSNSNGSVESFLDANGHVATDFALAAPSAANLAGADVAIALRSAIFNADLVNFISNGGLLITEWDSAEPALDVHNLLNADGGSNSFIGSDTPITVTPAGVALGLNTGLPNPYADGPRTEFQWTLSNIGAGVDILAVFGANVPAVIGGAFGGGYVIVNSLDWADAFPAGASASGQFLLNEIALEPQQVPEPFTTALVGLGIASCALRRRYRA
jgi:hypothetical protein